MLRVTTELRSLARKLGLVPYLAKARSLVQKVRGETAYEAHFDKALSAAVRPGDVVWDVGANLGLYTVRFSEAAGPTGAVVAFEPTPACFRELSAKVASYANVTALNCALGDASGKASMNLSDDPLGATHSLVSTPGATTVEVELWRGDEVARAKGLPSPNVVKIDVEGFEEEVVDGLGALLTNPTCRAVLIEVHFALLDGRGKRQAPARIEEKLARAGFAVSWVDASHLEARRG